MSRRQRRTPANRNTCRGKSADCSNYNTSGFARSFQLVGREHIVGNSFAFVLVNLALLRLQYRGAQSSGPHVTVPIWMPVIVFSTCVAMMMSALIA